MVSDVTFASWPSWKKVCYSIYVYVFGCVPWLVYILLFAVLVAPFVLVGFISWYLRPDIVTLVLAVSLSLAIAIGWLWRREARHLRQERDDYCDRWIKMREKCYRLQERFHEPKRELKSRRWKRAEVVKI